MKLGSLLPVDMLSALGCSQPQTRRLKEKNGIYTEQIQNLFPCHKFPKQHGVTRTLKSSYSALGVTGNIPKFHANILPLFYRRFELTRLLTTREILGAHLP